MLTQVQFAVFFRGGVVDSTDLLLRLKNNLGPILDGDPMLLPVAQGAPVDYPFLTIGSRDGRFLVTASRQRLDLIVAGGTVAPQIDWKTAISVFGDLRKALSGLELSRFGCTTTTFHEDSNPVQHFRERYLRETLAESCDEVFLRYNEPVMEQGIRINRLSTIQTGVFTYADGRRLPGLACSFDINTDASLEHIDNNQIDIVLTKAGTEGLAGADGDE